MAKLKLFVWEDIWFNYSTSMVSAIAEDTGKARKIILKNTRYIHKEDLTREPDRVIELDKSIYYAYSCV